MKRILLSAITILLLNITVSAQLKFDFYGFLRMDYYFDSRESVTANENLLFLYPKDVLLDANGEDLNEVSNAGFYAFNARPGVKVSGLTIGDAKLSGLIEGDFAGGSDASGFIRLRRAYANANWGNKDLLVGQEWHPFFNMISPGQLSLSTGAPFQPFNRSPQIKFSLSNNKKTASFDIAAIYQYQFKSMGPDGKSHEYHQNTILPELALTGKINLQAFSFGGGVSYLLLQPETQYEWQGNTYKTTEKIGAFSCSLFAQYKYGLFVASARSTLGQNTGHLTMLGGYGVSHIDATTGKREYTSLSQLASWVNLSYGNKYKVNLFWGNSQNLGTKVGKSTSLVENSALYGSGMDVQFLNRAAASFSYNIPHFRVGLEYEFSRANYGNDNSFNWSNGKYSSTHGVNNHRVTATASYLF